MAVGMRSANRVEHLANEHCFPKVTKFSRLTRDAIVANQASWSR